MSAYSRFDPKLRWASDVPLAVQATLHQVLQFPEAALDRVARGIELGLRARIVGATRIQDGDEVGHGLAVLRHRPEVTLLHHPLHMLVRTCPDPDRVTAAQKQRIGFRVRYDAAGGGDHGRIVLVDDAFEAGALVAPEGREPSDFDQIGY